MSITPVGGWGNGPNRAVFTDASVQSGAHCCPQCGSADWKAANLVHIEGLSVSRGRTRGTVIGISRTGLRNGQFSMGGGVYRGKTRGTSQTLLSQMAAPPKRSRAGSVVVGIFAVLAGGRVLGDLANDNINQNTFIAVLITVILLIVFFMIRGKQEESYSEAIDMYENMRMCQRCGTFYAAPW